MQNYEKCFQTCTKCLVSMNFLLSGLCALTISAYQLASFPVISDFLRFYKDLFGFCALFLSFLLFSHASCGVFALFKKNSRLLRFYAVFSAVFAGISLFFAVFVLLQCGFLRNFASFCNTDPKFLESATIYSRAEKILGSAQCPWEKFKKVQDCEGFRGFSREIVAQLQELEQKYECSGMCLKKKLYFFSDFRRKTPKIACGEAIFNGFYVVVGGIFVANALIVAIFAINAECLGKPQFL